MTARAWVLFAAVSVVWGIPYFFIKVAVEAGVPPALVAWSRVALGAAVLLPLAWRRGALRGLGGRWGPIVAYTVCEVAVPFLLIPAGEQHVSSSLAAILIASMPLMVALLSVRLAPEDRPTGLRLAGLVIGFGGVAALLGVDMAGRADELLGALLVLVATLGYATAPFIVNRRLADLDPLGPIAVSLALAVVLLAPTVLITPPEGLPPGDALGSLAVLGFVCTALGLVLFFQLVVEAGPSRAAVITYVNPLVAVVLGVFVLDERLGVMSLAGLLAILGGSWLATGRRGAAGSRPWRRTDPRRGDWPGVGWWVGPGDRGTAGWSSGQSGTGRAAHRASSAWTRSRHSRRAKAWLASVARRARRTRWCRARSASARSSATRSAA
ncbi:MAG TPA: DMT family transporter, partial [Actinomycetes bacterium]|nr:DMT family transporter [Actinomycetes bacterium]